MREIELEYGLQRVAPSIEAKRRSLTSNEINMAIRTGKEPPRQKLQRLLDEALKKKLTALELAEWLQNAGVSVRANISSTGRMNGFSFELDGVPFKGSDLGKAYTWAGLQKAGVTYVETRDRAGLERLRAAALPLDEVRKKLEAFRRDLIGIQFEVANESKGQPW